jgi:ribose transport system substrate-binding protein
MFRLPRLILLALLLSAGLTHAQTPAPASCPLDDGVVHIAWIPKALDNIVFELGAVGAETRAAELTEAVQTEGGCAVEVLVAAPMSTDADEQAALLDEVIDLGTFDAIAVSCIAPAACQPPIDRAIAAGMVVITWDSDSPESQRLTYYGTDNTAGGRAAAELLIRAMGESGQVALLSGVPGSQNLDERILGFSQVMASYPDIEIVEVVYGNDDPVLSAERVEALMLAYPDLDGFFFAGLWPFLMGRGAMPEWEAATLERGLVNVAFDTLPLQLLLMQEDLVQGLVGQKYWDWGYGSVQIVYDIVVNGLEVESFTDTGMDIVTPRNLAAMIAAWESNDFTQPLPDPFAEGEQ